MGKGDSIKLLNHGEVRTPALGSGRKGLKRIKKTVLDSKTALNKPSVRRLARRAGVKRISSGIYEEAPTALRSWLKKIVEDAVLFTEHAKRFTVTLNDIVMALKRNGITIYGFDITERRRRLTRPLPKEALAKAAQRVVERQQQAQKTINTRTRQQVKVAAEPAAKPQEQQQEAALPSDSFETAATGGSHEEEDSQHTPERLDASAPTSSPAVVEVSPERALEIQTSLGAFRDTVVSRQSNSDAKVSRVLHWVSNHLRGRGHAACSASELEVVLDVLAERDAVMVTVDDVQKEKVLWFV